MSRHALGSKNIRAELKKAFPGVKFRVRSQSYSGGCSIRVGWDFGPTTKAVEAVVDKYQYCGFDGMQDLKTYDREAMDRAEEHGGADYVFANRGYGRPAEGGDYWEDTIYGQVGRDLCEIQGVEYEGPLTRNVYGSGDDLDLSSRVRQILEATTFPEGWEYAGLEHDDDHGALEPPYKIVFKNG